MPGPLPVSPTLIRRTACLLMLLVLCVVGSACDNPSGGSPGTAPGSAKPTIVSLTPAITQMLIDMGKRNHLVGVSREDAAALGLPACGSYNDPLMPKILELNPDIVITESGTGGSDVPPLLRSLADEGVFELKVIPHSKSVADIERVLSDAELGLGPAIGDAASADRARRLMQLRLDLIQSALADAPRKRVLMLINPSTLGAIGSGVTHDQLLHMAAATNAAASYNTGYISLTRSQIQEQVRPDVILIFEPNGQPLTPNDARLNALQGLSVPAVTRQRIVVIRHPQAMLPATTLPEVLVEMAGAIHPDRAQTVQQAYKLAEQALDKASSSGGGS